MLRAKKPDTRKHIPDSDIIFSGPAAVHLLLQYWSELIEPSGIAEAKEIVLLMPPASFSKSELSPSLVMEGEEGLNFHFSVQ